MRRSGAEGTASPIAALRGAILPYALTRAALGAVALVALASLPFGIACGPCDLSSIPLVNALTRWDGGWYLSIARDGYAFAPGIRSNVAFSPLLPLLMRGLAGLTGRTDDEALLVAGLLVANAALVVALAYLILLTRLELGEGAARRTALYVLVFPTTVFLSALYPSSLFLALGAGTVVEARRGRRWVAAVLAGLGTLARPFGVVLVVPLVIQAALDRGTRPWRPGELLAALLPVAAFGGWQLYLYRLSGDPLLFLSAQAAYGRAPSAPLQGIADLLDPRTYSDPWIVAATLLLMTALVVGSWRVLHPATAACGTAIYLATLSSSTLTSFPRYALAFFPAFMVLGALGTHRAVHVAYLATATVLAVLLTAMFATWYWIG